MTTKNTALQKKDPSPSERFTAMVMREAGTNLELTEGQKRLLSNYFIALDLSLKTANLKVEQGKPEIIWNNINRDDLSKSVMANIRMGLDPLQPAQVDFIPYLNKRTGKYDISVRPGYKGNKIKAEKYGLDMPDNIRIKIVHEKDHFKPLPKNFTRNVESYEFEIAPNPFDRGKEVGGFYYKEYYKDNEKNELQFYTIEEIEKRKPKYNTPFWKNWRREMLYKTMVNIAYNSIPIDAEKVDEAYIAAKVQEMTLDITYQEVSNEIAEDVVKEPIKLPSPTKYPENNKVNVVNEKKEEALPESNKQEAPVEKQADDGLPKEPEW